MLSANSTSLVLYNYHRYTLITHPWVRSLLYFVLEMPLLALYLGGPGWLGGWSGRDISAVCADLTGVPETHWYINQWECERLVIRKFEALLIAFYFGLYLVALGWAIGVCIRGGKRLVASQRRRERHTTAPE